MPGTIQVSILGLVGLPSWLQSSLMTIKVSIGKQTHETKDKGDFSFPLASLRDNLNIWVYDSEGNDIAHTVVETRLIVEKGVWDDSFALDRGGHVRMKVRFNLTEHELNRIRSMRESASRKKQKDILIRSGSSSDLAVPSCDPLKTVHQTEDRAVSLANAPTSNTSPASDPEARSKANNYQKKQALPASVSASALDKLPVRQHVKEVSNPQYQDSRIPSDKGPCQIKPRNHDIQTVEDSNMSVHSEKLDSTSPPNKGAPKGPVEQAIKIAIMVGFGLLVFFTRQRR